MSYYITTLWNAGKMYYCGKGWIVRNSPFYIPKKLTEAQADKFIRRLSRLTGERYRKELA